MATINPSVVPDRYLELIHRFPLRPIRTEQELEAATAVIDDLIARPSLASEERDYLEVLSGMVEHYESNEHPFPGATNADVIRYLMGARELNQSGLAAATGIPVSSLSEVLSGKRGLSKGNIATLARFFNVSTATFHLE